MLDPADPGHQTLLNEFRAKVQREDDLQGQQQQQQAGSGNVKVYRKKDEDVGEYVKSRKDAKQVGIVYAMK